MGAARARGSLDGPSTHPYSEIVSALHLLVVALAVGGCSAAEPEGIPNIKLGMSPRDVRERFTPGGEGTWQTRLGADDDTIQEWTASPNAGKPTVDEASFEFHVGMLVAVRAKLHESVGTSSPPRVEATRRTVLSRDRSSLTLLSRDCPTHHEEAERLAKAASPIR